MAPPAADVDLAPDVVTPIPSKILKSVSSKSPLKYSGSLDQYKHFDVTNVIGREFVDLQLSQILNDDAKLRDLAITVSERGVVFFRSQDLNIEDQKILGQKLGELTGKPETSKLHRHALSNSKRGIAVDENGKLDDEVSVISSDQNRKFYKDRFTAGSKRLASEGWHADITFEHIPSDYAILKIIQPPNDAGGDTLWASGYELYDRLSPEFQDLATRLTATHHQPNFVRVAKEFGEELIETDRGAPENTGIDFKASHPVVRTNPVTGWRSLFAAGHQVEKGWIDNVTEVESELLKGHFTRLIYENHDLQVRFRWGKNDLAIWDNRSVFHTATNDYEGSRQGNRVVSLGEKPYFDPKSVSRREALASRG
ncbi:putative alpha-ketoglutarate-dependent sulfonate dioxygenase [Cyphellophora attinorum]|uniref:Putative alpha-ketoglutarate-dependent sulfonate dioxygenase n=1 Tax=Cyphellophora attinorum TaxID=1664694 RepID=A0A0N1GWY0_9EURO|nr:putative alpha-ketoglutarate-dependent sulfonate dioxygenase [Phialophora attinorum]KPI34564.1 putative alpha-ketoglutarate-dependent sulfonate dioxygenase [Phialophora attinorum]